MHNVRWYDPGLKPSPCNRKWNDQGAPTSRVGRKIPQISSNLRLNLALKYSIWVLTHGVSMSFCFVSAWNVVEVIGISVASPYSPTNPTNPLGVIFSKGWWNSVVSFDQILLWDPLKTRRLDSFGTRNLVPGAWHAKNGVHKAFRSQMGNVVGSLYDDIRSPQVRHQMVWNDKY